MPRSPGCRPGRRTGTSWRTWRERCAWAWGRARSGGGRSRRSAFGPDGSDDDADDDEDCGGEPEFGALCSWAANRAVRQGRRQRRRGMTTKRATMTARPRCRGAGWCWRRVRLTLQEPVSRTMPRRASQPPACCPGTRMLAALAALPFASRGAGAVEGEGARWGMRVHGQQKLAGASHGTHGRGDPAQAAAHARAGRETERERESTTPHTQTLIAVPIRVTPHPV